MGNTSKLFGSIIAHQKEKIYLPRKTGSENEDESGIIIYRLIHGGKKMSTFILELCDRKLSKLEIAVLDFITAHDITYHVHGGFPKMYTCYFRLDDAICIEQEIHIRDEDCLCYTNLSRSAKHMGSKWQEKILCNINRVNCTLDYGNFEVDLESGDIRYRTYFNPRNAIYWEDLDMFLGYPIQIIRSRLYELFSQY